MSCIGGRKAFNAQIKENSDCDKTHVLLFFGWVLDGITVPLSYLFSNLFNIVIEFFLPRRFQGPNLVPRENLLSLR